MLSYAGRTRHPAHQPVPVRVGGFGGAAGLAQWLREHGTHVLVDATHPFATRMHANAARAAAEAGVAFLRVLRPAWVAGADDDWTVAADAVAAASAVGVVPRRVFLTVGGSDLLPFAGGPHHVLVRAVDPPASLPRGARLITARGPFDVAGEEALFRREGVEVLVTKNSGGAATEAKLHAARTLGVRVVMIARPPEPVGLAVPGAAEAVAWLHARPTARGV